jgi:hypothetical protein
MSNIFFDYHQQNDTLIQNDREYSRIMTAAVVNEKFRKLLLSNPRLAIKNGYSGEAFHLALEESERISSIQATSLAEFARQMNCVSSQSGVSCFTAN